MEDILATKLFIPSIRPDFVSRPRLVEQLNESLNRKLTLISAPTGFGKTSLLSEWIPKSPHCVTWLSLDIEDNDLPRFWTYFIMSLQGLHPDLGQNALKILHSAMTPSISSVLSSLINDLSAFPDSFVSVLDDYHVIKSKPIDESLTFFLDHQPPNMHLVITTREDPNISLGRLRAQGQLNEFRINDLRFTATEVSELMNTVMGLKMSSEDILSLENRTEGWAAGLKLAAISMRGKSDPAEFIRTFTGSNRYIMDYLIDEVLSQQSETIKNFLLNTSILDRLCGPLCDAVMSTPAGCGQERLESLEQANLFLIPLDNERKWYRYHNLFADLLRQRLKFNDQTNSDNQGFDVTGNHLRASQWLEDNGFEIEAFEHAAAAGNLDRTARLMEGNGLPLHYRGAVKPVLNWLKSLPNTILDERPNLWVSYASVLMFNGQTNQVEAKLNAAESALQSKKNNETSRDLRGSIAAMRASLAVNRRAADVMMEQSRLALENLGPENQALRIAATWTLGYAHQLQKDFASAEKVYDEILRASNPSDNAIYTIAAATSLGQVREANNQMHLAEASYRQVLQLAGDPPMAFACEAYLGLARIFYQWNNLEEAEKNLQQSLELTRQLENVDTPAGCYLLSAQISLAKSDIEKAESMIKKSVRLCPG